VTLAELRARLETRVVDADACRATAPLGDTLRWLLAELGAVDGASGDAHQASEAARPLLTAREAATLLHVAPRFLYRHAKTLPFTRRLGPKTVRFDPDGLARWAARR
jgi:predicted DNA-binding transcriptional regulator AlpA